MRCHIGERSHHCWGGMVDMTRDRLPRAGERDGIYYSMGYSGHGSEDVDAVRDVASRIRSGQVHLNYPAWDPHAPFGGSSSLETDANMGSRACWSISR